MSSNETPADPPPTRPNVWMIRSGRSSEGLRTDEFWAQGVVALSFRAVEIGSVKSLSREEIEHRVLAAWDAKPGQIRSVVTQLYTFASLVEIGDVVVTPHDDPDYVVLGRIAGPYEYRSLSPVPGWRHVRMVNWMTSLNRASLTAAERRSLGGRQTIYQPRQADTLLRVVAGAS